MLIRTTDDLIADIKIRGAVPTSQDLFTNERFLSFANGEMLTKTLPLILGARENYYEYDIDLDINTTGQYEIPTRAYLGILFNLALISGDRRFDLPHISEDSQTNTEIPERALAGYSIKRNTIILKPKDAQGLETLRLSILLRPGTFVLEAAAGKITAINTTTKVVTFSSIPSTWLNTNTFDLIQGDPQYDHLGIDLTATTVDTVTQEITFTDTLPTRLVVGDWVGLAGESPIIQLPEAFAYYLSQRVANMCMRTLGDTKGVDAGVKIADEMEDGLKKTIQPRTQKSSRKMVSRNRLLRSNGYTVSNY